MLGASHAPALLAAAAAAAAAAEARSLDTAARALPPFV
jgi:hypothetical protein